MNRHLDNLLIAHQYDNFFLFKRRLSLVVSFIKFFIYAHFNEKMTCRIFFNSYVYICFIFKSEGY